MSKRSLVLFWFLIVPFVSYLSFNYLQESFNNRQRVEHFREVKKESILEKSEGNKQTFNLQATGLTLIDCFGVLEASSGACVNGSQVGNLNFKNKILIVNFFASWCEPCRKEMPSLEKLILKLPKDNFELVFVSIDDESSKALKFIRKYMNRGKFYLLWDKNQSFARDLGIEKYPETLIYNKKLELVTRVEGAIDWNEDKVVNFLFSLL